MMLNRFLIECRMFDEDLAPFSDEEDHEQSEKNYEGSGSGEPIEGSRNIGRIRCRNRESDERNRRARTDDIITEGGQLSGFNRGMVESEEISSTSIEITSWSDIETYSEETQMSRPSTSRQSNEGGSIKTDRSGEEERIIWTVSFNKCLLYFPPRRKIVHDIFQGLHDGNDRTRIGRICETQYPGAIFIVCEHGGHFHIVHDCEYHRNQCRCSRILLLSDDFGRRRSRRIIRTDEYTYEHWSHLADYFETNERKIVFFEISGRKWVSVRSDGRLQRQRHLNVGQETMVEARTNKDSISHFLNCGSESAIGEKTAGQSGGRHEGNTECEKRSKGHRLLEWLKKHPTASIKHVLNTTAWYNSSFKFWSRRDTTLKTCFALRQMELINITTMELYSYFFFNL